jgi:hypothetical protein
MPRKKPKDETQTMNATLPPPVLAITGARTLHRHERPVDAYEAPPGAVIVHPPTVEPVKRAETKTDVALKNAVQQEQSARVSRYDRYLDALEEHGGDADAALCDAYGYTPEVVAEQRDYLLADVRSTIGMSSIAAELERNDLSDRARVRLLRKHAYSANPAASLKALDAIGELAGARSDIGSFEDTLRQAKLARG